MTYLSRASGKVNFATLIPDGATCYTQCRCDVNTRSNVSQGFCQQIRLAHICTESDQLKTKSNPGKFLRKSTFSDFWAKIGVFLG